MQAKFDGCVMSRDVDVVIIHRYFWPQAYPYAQMLKEIAEGLRGSGLNVAVYTTDDSSAQHTDRVKWSVDTGISIKAINLPSERKFSVLMKIASALYFGVWVFKSVLASDAKVFWVASTPPVIMPVIMRIAKWFKAFKVIYHCQDVHPESMLVNGNLTVGLFYRLLRRIDKGNVEKVHTVIVLSRDMRQTILARGCSGGNVHIINNFVFGDDSKGSLEGVQACTATRVRTFLFAGSLGRFQNLDYLLEVFSEAADLFDYKLLFMGDGPLHESLRNKALDLGLNGITFMGQQPLSVALAAMDAADYGLVSLSPGVEKVAYPSKTIMYLSRGLPVVAFLPADNELSEMLDDNHLGFTVDTTVTSAREAALRFHQALLLFEANAINRHDIKVFCKNEFSKDAVIEKLVKVVSDTVNA